jgi:hypothetical protein
VCACVCVLQWTASFDDDRIHSHGRKNEHLLVEANSPMSGVFAWRPTHYICRSVEDERVLRMEVFCG